MTLRQIPTYFTPLSTWKAIDPGHGGLALSAVLQLVEQLLGLVEGEPQTALSSSLGAQGEGATVLYTGRR